jgi:hypothetical protein
MFIYEFLGEGLGQFSFQLTPPVVRPGGRVNVPPVPTRFATFPSPVIRTQYQVVVFYLNPRDRNWTINPRHTRYFQSVGEASSYFRALCEQGRAVGAHTEGGALFTRYIRNLPTHVQLSRNDGSGWTAINSCDS